MFRGQRSIGWAPATVANVGVGFDILGFSLSSLGDEVVAEVTELDPPTSTPLIQELIVTGEDSSSIPSNPSQNTASVAATAFLKAIGAPFQCNLSVKKGIPLASGLGGSAASAVAAVNAINGLLPTSYDRADLLQYALIGEAVASGAPHADNIAPALWGGLVACLSGEIRSLPIPEGLMVIIVHPALRVETRAARSALKSTIPLSLMTAQSAHLTGFLMGCYESDLELMGRHLKDLIIAPQRAHLIDGFQDAQSVALEAGAIGCSISGAGPSIFALSKPHLSQQIADQISAVFTARQIDSTQWIEPWGAPDVSTR